MDELLTSAQVKAILLTAISTGTLSFSKHALVEMAADGLTEIDVVNACRGAIVQPGEFVNTSYRYRVETFRMAAVVAIRAIDHAVVVTPWKRKRR